MAFCYILLCVDGSYCVGSTHDVAARVTKHTDGSASHYVKSAALAGTLATIRDLIPPGGDVAVIGGRDDLSPSLMKWQLGPPQANGSSHGRSRARRTFRSSTLPPWSC